MVLHEPVSRNIPMKRWLKLSSPGLELDYRGREEYPKPESHRLPACSESGLGRSRLFRLAAGSLLSAVTIFISGGAGEVLALQPTAGRSTSC